MREAKRRSLLELVVDCASVSSRAAFSSLLLRRMLELVPAELATHHEIETRSGEHVVRAAPKGSLFAGFEDACRPHAHEHPLFAYHTSTLDGRALKESDFLSKRRYQRRAIFQAMARPLGVEEQLTFMFAGPHAVNAVSLHDRWGRFGEGERALLDALRGPLARAYDTVRRRERDRRLLAALGATFDSAERPVVVLEPPARVAFVSPLARTLLARYRLAPGSLAGREGVVGRRDERRLVARAAVDAAELAVVVLDEEDAPHPLLTPREHEILELVADGQTNGEIAERLRISTRTVQTHLRNVYEKLGVRTRTGAVRRAQVTRRNGTTPT